MAGGFRDGRPLQPAFVQCQQGGQGEDKQGQCDGFHDGLSVLPAAQAAVLDQ